MSAQERPSVYYKFFTRRHNSFATLCHNSTNSNSVPAGEKSAQPTRSTGKYNPNALIPRITGHIKVFAQRLNGGQHAYDLRRIKTTHYCDMENSRSISG